MSEARHPTSPPARAVWTPLSISLAGVLFLATVGSFAAGFGVMTDCTDTYSCTTSACRPCSATSTWLNVGWVVQGLLLLIGTGLVVLSARRIQLRVVRSGALILGAASLAVFAVSTSLAISSY